MAQQFTIALTPSLVKYVKKLLHPSQQANYADYIGYSLVGAWGSPTSNSTPISSSQYHRLSSLSSTSAGNYTFSATSGYGARFYLLVPSRPQHGINSKSNIRPWIADGGGGQPPPITANSSKYVYAYGETNFDGVSSGNMDTTYIDSFGLPYKLSSVNSLNQPISINAGVGIASTIYNAVSSPVNKVSYRPLNSQIPFYTGALVPPANATGLMYHDFSAYLKYLAGKTKTSNYTAWLKNGGNAISGQAARLYWGNLQMYDGKAAFFDFNGKSGSQGTGYILVGGSVNQSTGSSVETKYSVIIPWTIKDIQRLGLTNAYNNYKKDKKPTEIGNFLSQHPHAYQNDATGFWVSGKNIFKDEDGKDIEPTKITKEAIRSTFSNAIPWDVSSQTGEHNAPPDVNLPFMVGDIFYGLNKGMLGSTVDFITGFSDKDIERGMVYQLWPGKWTTSSEVTTFKSDPPNSTGTMDVGDLPSEAWYSNSGPPSEGGATVSSLQWKGVFNKGKPQPWTGNRVKGPVASGLWGPWAWGTNAKNFWNHWSFGLSGRTPGKGASYNITNQYSPYLTSANSPLLPNTYAWSMDDRAGGQLLDFGANPLQLTFDAPYTT